MQQKTEQALAVIKLLLDNGVQKKNLHKVCEGLFDLTYLNEREILVRLSNVTKNFNDIFTL